MPSKPRVDEFYKLQKNDIIRRAKKTIAGLEKRIDYLEGKEFYEGITEDVRSSATKKAYQQCLLDVEKWMPVAFTEFNDYKRKWWKEFKSLKLKQLEKS